MCRNGETETWQCFEQRFGKSRVKIPQSTGKVIPKFEIPFGNDSDMSYLFIKNKSQLKARKYWNLVMLTLEFGKTFSTFDWAGAHGH